MPKTGSGRNSAVPHPQLVIIAGPNGAGKSTLAPTLLRDKFGIMEFVNADPIAQGLSAFRPETVAFEAGRTMLMRLRTLAQHRVDFAFETTLATRSYAPWIRNLKANGYRVHLIYLWLMTADLAVERVGERVRSGGHHVPEEVIRRRYIRGICNFFHMYEELLNTWSVYNNSLIAPIHIATGTANRVLKVTDKTSWQRIQRSAR